MTLRAIGFMGGKCAWGGRGSGRWIAAQLPNRKVYVEPFAGMLGVLLQRAPAVREIVNDLDSRLVNWWRAVRDHRPELEALLDNSPTWSAEFYQEALAAEQDPEVQADVVQAAYWFTLRLCWTFGGALTSNTLARRYGDFPARNIRSLQLKELQARVMQVEIEHRDALRVIREYGGIEDAVMYCDPPYQAAGKAHDCQIGDKAAMVEALQQCRGLVAVSGYEDDWDELGWRVNEMPVLTSNLGVATERVERLWTNYRPGGQMGLL